MGVPASRGAKKYKLRGIESLEFYENMLCTNHIISVILIKTNAIGNLRTIMWMNTSKISSYLFIYFILFISSISFIFVIFNMISNKCYTVYKKALPMYLWKA